MSSSKPHAVTAAGANSYTYDTNGNMLTGAGRTFTWNGENQPVQIAKTGTPTETYVYDGDNVRIKRTVASSPAVTSIYVGKVEYRGTQVISTYGGVASRTTTGTPTSSNRGTIVYMHTDHLGSVSMTTSATGTVAQTQEFDPWGAVKAGGITSVSYNYTGQRLDGTGLLFYNARYYDPQLARFTSADSIVPGFHDDRVALRPLTVDFHESKFVVASNYENKFTSTYGFHFQLSKKALKKEKYQWGPKNVQALNRYTYVLNNPLRYTDPSGHRAHYEPVCSKNGKRADCSDPESNPVKNSDGQLLYAIRRCDDCETIFVWGDGVFHEFEKAVDQFNKDAEDIAMEFGITLTGLLAIVASCALGGIAGMAVCIIGLLVAFIAIAIFMIPTIDSLVDAYDRSQIWYAKLYKKRVHNPEDYY